MAKYTKKDGSRITSAKHRAKRRVNASKRKSRSANLQAFISANDSDGNGAQAFHDAMSARKAHKHHKKRKDQYKNRYG